MRVFSAKRVALLAFALLALLALGAAQGGAELELAEIDDAELDALLSDAEALGLDTGEDVGADVPDQPSGAIEPVPETPEDPEPAGAGAVEPVPEPEPEPEPVPAKKKEKSRPIDAAPAPPAYKSKGPPPNLTVRLGQEPGACTYCKAAAHKLQVALTHAHLEHHDDHERVEIARSGKEKLPEDVFLRHMREVRQRRVLVLSLRIVRLLHRRARFDRPRPGLERPERPARDADGGGPRARPQGGVQEDGDGTEHAGLYRVFWEGREAHPGRKWYFQNEFCYASGHACHPATLQGRDEL